MKRWTVLVLLLTIGCDKVKALAGGGEGGTSSSPLAFFGADFEGEITVATTARGARPTELVFGIKNPKYRVDVTGDGEHQATLLLAPAEKKGYLLQPAQKMAIVVDFDKARAGANLPGLPNLRAKRRLPETPPKIEKTGKKESVAGYACEVWNVTSDGGRAELCVAQGITWIDVGDLAWASPELAAAALATEANHFPLRVVTFDAKGGEDVRMQATKVDKKKLDDTRMNVPPDYRVLDPAAMMPAFPKPRTSR